MLMIIQAGATEPQIQIAQETVIAIIVASTVVVLGLLWLIGHFASKAPTDDPPLHYGNFFVVVFGIMTVLIGFLVAFPLAISNVFSDPTQVIALLSALFGTIVGLVGTYFGVKSSSDAAEKAHVLSQRHPQPLPMSTTQGNNVPRDEAASETLNGAASGTTITANPPVHPRLTDLQGGQTEPDAPPEEGGRKGWVAGLFSQPRR
jgi:uncharacterized protein YacL